jgi:hypothetical protein
MPVRYNLNEDILCKNLLDEREREKQRERERERDYISGNAH